MTETDKGGVTILSFPRDCRAKPQDSPSSVSILPSEVVVFILSRWVWTPDCKQLIWPSETAERGSTQYLQLSLYKHCRGRCAFPFCFLRVRIKGWQSTSLQHLSSPIAGWRMTSYHHYLSSFETWKSMFLTETEKQAGKHNLGKQMIFNKDFQTIHILFMF